LLMSARGLRRFSRGLADALRLPRTAARIVDLLSRTQQHLSVRQIVSRVRMSERSVRGNLSLLLRRGLLERRVVVTAQKRIAYLYRLRPTEEIMGAVRRQFTRNLNALRGASRRGLSPKTASSSRN